MLVHTITSKDVITDDFPVPSNCLKCAKQKTKKNVCPYHLKLIGCCKFCKCEATLSSNNTFN